MGSGLLSGLTPCQKIWGYVRIRLKSRFGPIIILFFSGVIIINTIDIGKKIENIVRDHLQQYGLKFVASNYRCKLGEVDLIMIDGKILGEGSAVDNYAIVQIHPDEIVVSKSGQKFRLLFTGR